MTQSLTIKEFFDSIREILEQAHDWWHRRTSSEKNKELFEKYYKSEGHITDEKILNMYLSENPSESISGANWKEQQLPAGTTVYVPIEIKEGCELPREGSECAVLIGKGDIKGATYFKHKGFCYWAHGEGEWSRYKNISHWLKETTIPDYESLSAQIENLQDQVIKEQEESKRLKELIERRERMWFGKFTESANPIVVDNHWNDFKRSNNI